MDPEMAHTILMRRNDFLQLEISIKIFSIFGDSLSSSNGSEWQRNRKIVGPVFNERIMKNIWNESSAQAREMLDTIFKESSTTESETARESDDLIIGVRNIAPNVFGFIVYGDRSYFTEASREAKPPPGYRLTFMESILSILNNHCISLFVPPHILLNSWMPKSMQKMGMATEKFPRHTKDLIAKERATPSAQNTLLGTMVKITDSDMSVSSKTTAGRSVPYFSENEITGNLFNLTLAGFDTTSNTMAYAFIILAMEPKWQDWMVEEIDRMAKLHPNHSYESTFPVLTRCMAFMYETLRLYTPALHIPRCTHVDQTSPVFIPADTTVHVALSCLHVSPTLYSPDPLTFRPTRWISSSSAFDSKSDGDQEPASESLVIPPKGTFMPFFGGPRSCPGTKMAQVEFIAVMREIFSTWRVEAAKKEGETIEMARERLAKVVEDSQPKITLQVKKPKDVLLKWVRR
ncbi:hypothetical protein MMC25_003817 [Agyrium rufum]|nr:hypothetical protein [Agyrium rufum]